MPQMSLVGHCCNIFCFVNLFEIWFSLQCDVHMCMYHKRLIIKGFMFTRHTLYVGFTPHVKIVNVQSSKCALNSFKLISVVCSTAMTDLISTCLWTCASWLKVGEGTQLFHLGLHLGSLQGCGKISISEEHKSLYAAANDLKFFFICLFSLFGGVGVPVFLLMWFEFYVVIVIIIAFVIVVNYKQSKNCICISLSTFVKCWCWVLTAVCILSVVFWF